MVLCRDNTEIQIKAGSDMLLSVLYGSALGRAFLKPLTAPAVSKIAGKFLSTRASRFLIGPFIRRNQIDMTQFEEGPYRSYNDFFSRRVLPEARPIDYTPMHFISPCDSKLCVFDIDDKCRLHIKHTEYSVKSLLRDENLANEYAGGKALVFTLTVDDYHRYCYPADGEKSGQTTINGVLHTVRPIGNEHFPVYKENTREYCRLSTEKFSDLILMEVGALMIGRIVNHHDARSVFRGDEKGYFQFGGSTIVILAKKDTIEIDSDILENSRNGFRTVVKLGEKIGISKKI